MTYTRCPNCGAWNYRVIYAGFPMWLCSESDCSSISGFWSFVMEPLSKVLPFNGSFYVYTTNYFQAMARWLLGDL